jgi:WD40 repeat protein
VRLYDTNAAKAPFTAPVDFGWSVFSCDFNCASPVVAAALEGGVCRLWDIRADVNLRALDTTFDDDLRIARWSPVSEHMLAVGDSSGRVVLFDIRQERAPYFFGQWKRAIDDGDQSNAHEHGIIGLVFAANGRTLHSLDSAGVLRVWDVDLGLSTLEQHRMDLTGERQRKLEICIFENDVLVPIKNSIMNVQKGDVYVGHMKDVRGVAAHSDGFVSCGSDRFLCVWRRKEDVNVPEDHSDWSD